MGAGEQGAEGRVQWGLNDELNPRSTVPESFNQLTSYLTF